MKTLEIEVTYKYTIEVDEKSNIVKEYKDQKELINDLVDYRFTVIPVINNGVKIKDIQVLDWDC